MNIRGNDSKNSNDSFMENISTDRSITRDQADHKEGVTSVTLKGSVFTLPIVKIHHTDLTQVAQDLQRQLDAAPGFFKDSPVILDLSLVQEHTIDFASLKIVLKGCELVPVGVQNGSELQQIAAIGQGLGIIPSRQEVTAREVKPKPAEQEETPATDHVTAGHTADEEQQPEQQTEEQSPVHEPQQPLDGETLVVTQPIRSGQRVYARGGDLIQLAAVNAGAEIMADGNIHIYAPLRGRALAGVGGNENTRIFCHSFEAELVAVAGSYRVFEDNIPADIYKKSVQIYLQQEQLIIRSIS